MTRTEGLVYTVVFLMHVDSIPIIHTDITTTHILMAGGTFVSVVFASGIVASALGGRERVEPDASNLEAVESEDRGHPHNVLGPEPHDEFVRLSEEPFRGSRRAVRVVSGHRTGVDEHI